MMKIWTCKIGIVDDDMLPQGADSPMRQAIKRAYRELTGVDCDFCFSGWGGRLDDTEAQVVNEWNASAASKG